MTPRVSPRPGDRGVVLILTVALVLLLVVVAAALSQIARIGRGAARDAISGVHARLLAASGVEVALTRLRAGEVPSYGGEDWDGSGALDGIEIPAETFRRGVLDLDCPVECALRPAWFSCIDPHFDGAGARAPAWTVADGRTRGFSGRLRGTYVDRYGLRGDTYVLRVRGGGLAVNDGALDAGDDDSDGIPNHRDPDTGHNGVLRRILGTLAEALDREDGADDGRPVDEADGHAFVDVRPAGGWTGREALLAGALGGDAAKGLAFEPYLSFRSWSDPRVVVPNADRAMVGAPYRSWCEIRLAHAPGMPGTRAPDYVRSGGRVTGRAPVDLSWAMRRRPVLLALLAGLEGVYLDESVATVWVGMGPPSADSNRIGVVRSAAIANVWDPADDAHVAANAILARADPFRSWEEWSAFCDMVPFVGGGYEVQAKRDILKANFNPNTDLNKFNPGAPTFKRVDKSDLLVWSTEFSLFPVHGCEIESAGRVVDAAGAVHATRTVRASSAPPQVVRWTTQRDFVCADLGDPVRAGDETGTRQPGEALYISANACGARTWGHALGLGGGLGISLQSYPEPHVDVGAGLTVRAAEYDGSLALATVETRLDDTYGVAAGPNDMKALARFDDSFDLDVADSFPGNAQGRGCVADSLQVDGAERVNSVWDAAKPNTLMPDGAHSESKRAPAYRGLGNMHGFRGVLSVWVRPGYDRPRARPRPWVMATNLVDSIRGVASRNQFFALTDSLTPTTGTYRLAFQFEGSHAGSDQWGEHQVISPNVPPSRQWCLATAFWDCLSPQFDFGKVVLDTGPPGRWGSSLEYPFSWNSPAEAQDLTQQVGPSEHLVSLGTRDPRDFYGLCFTAPYSGEGADATFDEFALYDFGGATGGVAAPPETVDSPLVLAQSRHLDGRYYRGWAYRDPDPYAPAVPDEAASFFTQPVRLPPGTVVRSAHWTWLRPPGLPDDFAEVEFLHEEGDVPLWAPTQSRASLAPGWSAQAQSWQVGRATPGALRVRVSFRRAAALDPNVPLLDSPVLDDLTLVCVPPGGTAIAAWDE